MNRFAAYQYKLTPKGEAQVQRQRSLAPRRRRLVVPSVKESAYRIALVTVPVDR